MTGETSSSTSRLLVRVRAQDPLAWQRLVELYGPLVHAWCRRGLDREEDRADVFQEVFRAVAIHVGEFRNDRPGDSFRGWLATITRNKVRDHCRRQAGRPQAVGGSAAHQAFQEVPELPELDEAESMSEQTALVSRALNLIRGDFEEATWQAFWRSAVEDQPAGQIAADLNLSPNAVYKAKARVLRRLREEVGDLFD